MSLFGISWLLTFMKQLKFFTQSTSIEKTNRIQRSQVGSRKNGQWIDLKDRIYGIKSQHEVLLSGLKLT